MSEKRGNFFSDLRKRNKNLIISAIAKAGAANEKRTINVFADRLGLRPVTIKSYIQELVEVGRVGRKEGNLFIPEKPVAGVEL